MRFQSLETRSRRISNHWKSVVLCFLAATATRGSSARADGTNAAMDAAATNAAARVAGAYVLGATNVLGEQLFAFVPTVDIAGTIADDALIAAIQTAVVTGTVSNDLWLAAGQSAKVDGHVGDHARVAAVAVELGGRFDRSVAALGQNVLLATNAIVSEDAYLAGFRVTAEGRVASNVHVQAGSATIGGDIRGTVRVTATDIAVLPNTRIGGDLVYTSEKELFLDKSVVVGGRLTHEKPPVASTADLLAAQFSGSLFFWCGAMLTGTLFVVLFPRFTGQCVRVLRHTTWRCVFTGAFATLMLPLLAIFAFSTFLAALFGAALAAAFWLLLYLGNIVVALTLGGVLLRRHGPQPVGGALLTLAFGLAVLYAAKALPLLGFVIAMTAWFAGIGALLLNLLHTQRIMSPLPPPVPGDGRGNENNDSRTGVSHD